MNPSLANRLRIGFAITFALLAGVTVIGVGRLFQLRQDFEDATTRSFELEVAGEHLRQAFIVEQAALRSAATEPAAARARYREAVRTADAAAADARAAGRGPGGGAAAPARAGSPPSAAGGCAIAEPILRGRAPPPAEQARLARDVIGSGDALLAAEAQRREALRDDVSDDTRKTALLVGVGLISGLIAAVLLFSGPDRLDAAAPRAARRRRRQARRRRPAGAGRGRRPGRDGDPRHRVQRDGRRAADRLPSRRGEPPAPRGDAGEPLRRRDHRRREGRRHRRQPRRPHAASASRDRGADPRRAVSGTVPPRRLERLLAGREQEELARRRGRDDPGDHRRRPRWARGGRRPCSRSATSPSAPGWSG